MREYLKNGNEYMEDGRRWVEKIKRCHCYKKSGDLYYMECRIHQRGENLYRCAAGTGYIEDYMGKKPLWLSEDAGATVRAGIEEFKRSVRQARAGFQKAPMDSLGVTLYYAHEPGGDYSYIIEFRNKEGAEEIRVFEKQELHSMLFDISFAADKAFACVKSERELLTCSAGEAVRDNPLYRAAQALGDVLLQDQLSLYFNADDAGVRRRLSARFGWTILPCLSKDFDRFYVVEARTVNSTLLERSGYRLLHVPYFAMRGKTHEKCAINPHIRVLKDAAAGDAAAMSFKEFLKMIKENAPA